MDPCIWPATARASFACWRRAASLPSCRSWWPAGLPRRQHRCASRAGAHGPTGPPPMSDGTPVTSPPPSVVTPVPGSALRTAPSRLVEVEAPMLLLDAQVAAHRPVSSFANAAERVMQRAFARARLRRQGSGEHAPTAPPVVRWEARADRSGGSSDRTATGDRPHVSVAARCSSRGPRRLRPAFPVPTASLRWPSTHSHAVTEQPPRGREAQDSPDPPGHSWSPTPRRASTPQPRVNPSAHPTSVAPATSRTYRLIVGACGRCGCVTEFRPGPRGDFGSNTGSLQHPVIVTSGKQHAATDLKGV
jgi:hypothetical protein